MSRIAMAVTIGVVLWRTAAPCFAELFSVEVPDMEGFYGGVGGSVHQSEFDFGQDFLVINEAWLHVVGSPDFGNALEFFGRLDNVPHSSLLLPGAEEFDVNVPLTVTASVLDGNGTVGLTINNLQCCDLGALVTGATLWFDAILCNSVADCDDGLFCNGMETCDVVTGLCLPGTPPCVTFEGYTAPCDDDLGLCTQPDTCFTWMAGATSAYFFPHFNLCPDTASWVFDDVQGSHHTTGVLDWYTTPLLGRTNNTGELPYLLYTVEQALWTVDAMTCNPLSIIAGTECTNTGALWHQNSGAPPDLMRCDAAMPALPRNDGDFDRCEIDFFMAYRTAENGAGMLIAGQKPVLGGPAGEDDFGVSVIWIEDCPPTGSYRTTFFGDDNFLPADFATAVVCQKPGGTCCAPDGSCSLTSESDCAAIGGSFGFSGTINGTDGSCGGDPDGDGIDTLCGDNCPDDSNPGQGDCDGDGEGDACEAAPCEQDDDTDGVCNCVDNCSAIQNPGQEDTDGDGVGNPCDPCPIDQNDDSDGDGVCDSADQCPGGDDRFDDDSDGVPDDCDVCPGSDDNVPGARDDADGDGVLNCNDLCAGVDDTVFAPECEGAIPTTSQWGLIVLTLLLLAGGKILFGVGGRQVARS